MCFINIILLCFASFFVIENSSLDRNILGYSSGIITFILLIIVLTAHTFREFRIKPRRLKLSSLLEEQLFTILVKEQGMCHSSFKKL